MFDKLEIRRKSLAGGRYELWEAEDASSSSPDERIYSCIALDRENWTSDWPALGGTRWVEGKATDLESGKEFSRIRAEATSLASAMNFKNTLIREAAEKAAQRARQRPAKKLDSQTGIPENISSNRLFGWQGGKGVIWTPVDYRRAKLSPRRLLCHARLIESLGGEYIGSKDQGIGGHELKWVNFGTRYTIGLGCKRDTGEATAIGVIAGLEIALSKVLDDVDPENPLRGVHILVAGAGKVGLPLIRELYSRHAELYVYEPNLGSGRNNLQRYVDRKIKDGAAVEWGNFKAQTLIDILGELDGAGRLFFGKKPENERRALEAPDLQVISPNGGLTGWLSEDLTTKGETRAEIIADAARRNDSLRLVLGAGNDQVPVDNSKESSKKRLKALATLAEASVWFVPDPLVSPGGVVAVSHELATHWDRQRVHQDTRAIVQECVKAFWDHYGSWNGQALDPNRLWAALTRLVDEPWS